MENIQSARILEWINIKDRDIDNWLSDEIADRCLGHYSYIRYRAADAEADLEEHLAYLDETNKHHAIGMIKFFTKIVGADDTDLYVLIDW